MSIAFICAFVKQNGTSAKDTLIKRLFNPKYPYEYLRLAEERKNGVESNKKTLMDETKEFFMQETNE